MTQWQQLEFQSSFDTFVEEGSVQGYGVYDEHPSNIFKSDTRSISLYVEPVGYGYQEGADYKGNILYSFKFAATITISDGQGNPLTGQIPAEFEDPFNSHNKATEAFIPIMLDLDNSLPSGDYIIIYRISDGTSDKSFEIKKDIKVVA